MSPVGICLRPWPLIPLDVLNLPGVQGTLLLALHLRCRDSPWEGVTLVCRVIMAGDVSRELGRDAPGVCMCGLLLPLAGVRTRILTLFSSYP